MARKRLNTKFLTIAGIVVGVVLLIAVVGAIFGGDAYRRVKWMVRGTPAEHAEKARKLYTENKFEEAGESFKRAMQLKGAPDAQMYTELGDCYSHLALADRENLIKAKACWDQAVAIDQAYVPALKRILDLLEADAERTARGTQAAERWEGVRVAAARLLQVAPDDVAAKVSFHRAILQRWTAGVDVGQTQVDESIRTLLAEADKNGKVNSDALFYGMSAMMQRAVERLKVPDRPGANAILAEVLRLVDASLAAYPNDAGVHFRAASTLRMLGFLERAETQAPKYQDRVKEEFEKAAQLVKPTDEYYVEMKLTWVKILESVPDQAGAEKIYRALLAELPADLSVRISYAEMLARISERRQDAIDLLENAPPPDMAKVAGIKAWIAKEQESVALFTLLNTKLDMHSSMRNKPEAAKLLSNAEEIYSKLSSYAGMADSPMGLQARGRLELARGQNLQAKQTLERALSMLPARPTTPAEADQRFRLMFMLAGADLATDQTGHAKSLLQELVAVDSKFVATRLMLAQLLIREKNMLEAKLHVDELIKLMPNSPVVTRLKIFTLDPEKDKDEITSLMAKLPDASRDEIVEKAQMAVFAGRKPDAIKLFESARAMDVNDLAVVVALARLYSDTGDKTRGLQLLDDAIAKNPDKTELKYNRGQIAGDDDLGGIRRDMIGQIQDPVKKALALHDVAVQEGNKEEAAKALATAIQLEPNNGRVVDLEFRYALMAKDWPKATEFMEQLAKLNQDQAGGLLYRVRLSLARGDLKGASEQAQQLTRTMPEFAQSWVVLGQVQRAQAMYAEALASFDRALSKQPGNTDAIRGAVDSSYAINDTRKARQYITQGRNMAPNATLFKEAELQWELSYGDPNKVIAPREENLKVAIENRDPAEQQAWLALGNTYLAVAATKDPTKDAAAIRQLNEKARDTFKAACAKFPDEVGFTKFYVDTLVQLKDQATAEKAIATLAARPAWQNKPEPVLLLASVYARMNKPADQEKTLRDFLATTPQSVPVQIQLSSLLSRQNKLDEALKLLEPNADEPSIRRQRIELQLNGGRLTEAEKEIQTALAATPTPSPFLLVRHANVLMQSGRSTQALSLLEDVISKNPNNSEALFYRAQIYVAAKKNLPQAIADMKAIREIPGTELQVRALLAEAYHYAGDDDASIRELEDAIAAFPTEKGPRLRLLARYREYNPPRWSQAERLLSKSRALPVFEKDLDFVIAEASMWLDRKDPTKANEMVTIGSRIAPNDMNLFRISCEVMFQAKQYKQLIARTDAIVKNKATPAPWWVYQYRGRAKKADTSDRAAALEEFTAGLDVAAASKDTAAETMLVQTISDEIGALQAAARLKDRAEKGDTRYRIMLASVLASDNDLPGAISWVERVIGDSNAKPEDLDTARTMAGVFYLKLNPPEMGKAADAYRKILERSPEDLIALNNLASVMLLPKSGFAPKEALPYSEKAYNILVAKHEVNPYIFDTHGYVLVLLGRLDEGINILQKAIDKEPIAEACYHMGEAFIAKGASRQADAEESLKQAAALLDAATKDNKPIDTELKSKIDNALERSKQLAASKS